MFSFDDRTRALLAAIDAEGSVSRAAGRIGLDPSNALRHLRAAERRTGRPLVHRRRGGRGNRARLTPTARALIPNHGVSAWPGRAAEYDQDQGVTRLVVGCRNLWAAGRLPMGPVRIRIRPEDVVVERSTAARGTSLRNAMPARVHRIVSRQEGVVDAELVLGALRLTARLTKGAVKQLRLRPGSRVVARFKATAVLAEPVTMRDPI